MAVPAGASALPSVVEMGPNVRNRMMAANNRNKTRKNTKQPAVVEMGPVASAGGGGALSIPAVVEMANRNDACKPLSLKPGEICVSGFWIVTNNLPANLPATTGIIMRPVKNLLKVQIVGSVVKLTFLNEPGTLDASLEAPYFYHDERHGGRYARFQIVGSLEKFVSDISAHN